MPMGCISHSKHRKDPTHFFTEAGMTECYMPMSTAVPLHTTLAASIDNQLELACEKRPTSYPFINPVRYRLMGNPIQCGGPHGAGLGVETGVLGEMIS